MTPIEVKKQLLHWINDLNSLCNQAYLDITNNNYEMLQNKENAKAFLKETNRLIIRKTAIAAKELGITFGEEK